MRSLLRFIRQQLFEGIVDLLDFRHLVEEVIGAQGLTLFRQTIFCLLAFGDALSYLSTEFITL